MLKIEPIKSYKIPRYPQGFYCEPPDTRLRKVTGSIVSAAVLAILLSSCKPEPVAVVGPPPVAPDLVTEREARTVIEEVFAINGINLEADVPFSFSLGDQNPVSLDLDGFNKDLNIGYEYIVPEDQSSFTQEVVTELDKAIESNGDGPYIKTISVRSFYDNSEKAAAYEELENIIQDFITDLRSRGII